MEKLYETQRLILKTIDESYGKSVVDYYMRNRDFLHEWEPKREEYFYRIEYQNDLLRKDQIDMDEGRLLRLWLFKKEDKMLQKIIGTISFSNIIRGAFQSCFLGYKLDECEINKGYATEAVGKGIDIMFDEYMLHRIEANIMPRNKRSIRVVEKLGFFSEGISRKYLKINGVYEDHIHMVLLNEKNE